MNGTVLYRAGGCLCCDELKRIGTVEQWYGGAVAQYSTVI